MKKIIYQIADTVKILVIIALVTSYSDRKSVV